MSIWCGAHQMRSTSLLAQSTRQVTTPAWWPVMVFLSSVDTPISLAHHLMYNASMNLVIRLKMLIVEWHSNMALWRGASWPARRDSRHIHVGWTTIGRDACFRRQPTIWPKPIHRQGCRWFATVQQQPERACTDRQSLRPTSFVIFMQCLAFWMATIVFRNNRPMPT